MYRLLLLLPLLLAACAPAGSYDPELAAIDARAKADALSAQAAVIAERTEIAAADAIRATEVEQARRDNASATEIALIDKQMEQRKFEIQARATEAAIWASAGTATAAPMATQQAWTILQTPIAATQQAIVRQAQSEEARAQAWQLIYDYGPIALGILAAMLIVALALVILTSLQRRVILNDFVRTPAGWLMPTHYNYKLLPYGDRRTATPDAESDKIIDYDDLPAVDISPGPSGRSYALFNTPRVKLREDEKERAAVLEFLEDAIEIGDDDPRKLPGWREMKESGYNYNSDSWQERKGWLADRGLVESNGTGTFVAGYANLQELQFAIATGQIK